MEKNIIFDACWKTAVVTEWKRLPYSNQKSRDVENRLKAAFLSYRHVSRHYQRHVTPQTQCIMS